MKFREIALQTMAAFGANGMTTGSTIMMSAKTAIGLIPELYGGALTDDEQREVIDYLTALGPCIVGICDGKISVVRDDEELPDEGT